jgi:hypothetical protein
VISVTGEIITVQDIISNDNESTNDRRIQWLGIYMKVKSRITILPQSVKAKIDDISTHGKCHI